MKKITVMNGKFKIAPFASMDSNRKKMLDSTRQKKRIITNANGKLEKIEMNLGGRRKWNQLTKR